MKNHPAASLALALALTVVFSSPGHTADGDAALLRRMSGTYTAPDVLIRQSVTGSPDSYFPSPVTLVMPRGKGRMGGSVFVSFPISGQVTKVTVSGRRVIYTGRLNVFLPGLALRQNSFRAVASPAGARRETLALTIKATGDVGPGVKLTYTAKVRGTK